ncbi:cell wall-associated NlpC family hydrolase [Paenibacillus sp. DS2015]|uniref:C40 family peptidase n=1 Tax=Paenibacillus sp. DS2015 TaxID=3373917 RepID=UPI003D1DB327
MIKPTYLGKRSLKTGATCIILLLCISCSNTAKEQDTSPSANAAGTFTDKVLYTDYSGKTWIPLEHAVQSLGLRMKDSGNAVQIGYTDPMYQAYLGHKKASSLGTTVHLKEAPIRQDGKLYLTSDSLSSLLHTDVKWNQRYHRIEISPLHDVDSSKKIQQKSLSIASTSTDTNELISHAKKYLGVPYEFGAEPYEQTKTFDCSSFTQHVYKKVNKDLPRLARQQGEEGSEVTRDNLKPGDLIFFTVPGRFEKNTIPGHVGIYIGEGKFIHTWGDPGVQISNLDTGYWSNVILFMRRVL